MDVFTLLYVILLTADYVLNAPSSSTVSATVETNDRSDFIPGWHNYNSNGKKLDPISEVPSSSDSALLQEEQQHGSIDTDVDESVPRLKLVQHDFSSMAVPSAVANRVGRWGLPFALTVFVAYYLSVSRKTAELENNTMMGASCAVGPFSAVPASSDATLTTIKSRGPWLLGVVSAASQLVDTAENGPTAHEAPVMVLFSSSAVFRETERYGLSRQATLRILHQSMVFPSKP